MVPLSALTDLYLVREVRAGNREAFSSLYRRNGRRVYGMLYRLAGSVEVAEDLTQETFLTAFHSLDTYQSRGAFSTWLCGIALRTYRGHIRRAGAQPSTEPLGDDDSIPGNPGDDPLAACTCKEAEQALEKAIQSLPTAAREAFVLIRVEGQSYQEAADYLEIPLGTVQSRLHRATQLLHRTLHHLIAEDEKPRPTAPTREARHVVR